MDLQFWEEQYRNVQPPALNPVLTGFNVNLDRIIPLDRTLLDSLDPADGIMGELKDRLVRSMELCTAAEWIVDNPESFRQITDFFAGYGSLSLGGQAGIAAVHLAGLGVPEVFCAAPVLGRTAARHLISGGVRVPGGPTGPDVVHTILEYPPGLVPLASGAVARNNRFIISPKKTAETVLLGETARAALNAPVRTCTRAFLSGYQYLTRETEFREAVRQVGMLRRENPAIRVHIECVSVTDPDINAGIVRHILPAADSAGMNENEISLLLRHPAENGPAGLAGAMFTLAEQTNLSRIHLHTFGFYLQLIRRGRADPDYSRHALLWAARTAASATGGSVMSVSPRGLATADELALSYGPESAPGIFVHGDYYLLAIPTLVVQDVRTTTGLGDIISSSAFVADRF